MPAKPQSQRRALWDTLPVGLVELDRQGKLRHANRRLAQILGLDPDQPQTASRLQRRLAGLFAPDQLPFAAVARTGRALYGLERSLERPDGTTAIVSINCAPLWSPGGRRRLAGALATLEEITDYRLNQEDREKLIQELRDQSLRLEELNDALKVLLARRDQDRRDLEEKIIFNLKSLVLPYLERLRASLLSSEQRAALETAQDNLEQIFSPFGTTLSSQLFGLTPRELEVANLVKLGRPSKEIAELLCISVRSVETHRRAIRRKLGLRGRGVNLRAFLSTLS